MSVFQRLARSLDSAEKAYRAGNLNEAWSAAVAALTSVSECTDSGEAAIIRARSYELQGIVFQDWGQNEDALKAYGAGADCLERFPQHRVFLGRIQISLFQLCAGLELEEDAARYAALALSNVEGTEYEVYVRQHGFYTSVDSQQLEWREELRIFEAEIAELEKRSSQYPTRRIRPRTKREIAGEDAHYRHLWGLRRRVAGLQIQHGTDAEAEDGFVLIGALAEVMLDEMKDYREFQHLTSVFSFLIDRPDINFRYVLKDLVPKAFEAARATRSPELAGQAHFLAALLHVQNRDTRSAIADALTSLALGTNCLTRTQSVVLRQLFKNQLDERRDLALTLCIQIGDTATAAELIESERLQTLPERGQRLTGDEQIAGFRDMLDASLAKIGALRDVSVNGVSQLFGRAAPYFTTAGQPVHLENVIHEVGGSDAWWWGAFFALRRMHWVVRASTGETWCGTRHLTEADALVMTDLNDDLIRIGQGDASVWAEPSAEASSHAALGQIVVPEVLRRRLLSQPADTSLVVTGNLLAAMPLGLLALDDIGDVRLVERAVVRIQPPAFLVDQVASRAHQATTNYPLLIACTDPTGDLEWSRHRELAALIAVTNAVNDARPRAQATRENLVNALAHFPSGYPGVFFYSGHASFLDVNGGLNAVLVLQDDSVIAAGDWLGVFDDAPPLACPSRAVISACDSSGASGTGGGEWLGLAAALLFAGAETVIATSWPIADSPFTAAFEHELLLALENASDPAALLTGLQRTALERWRYIVELDPARTALPLIWSAFQCIGIRRGSEPSSSD